MTDDHLAPPRAHYVNPEYTVPLTPPSRPPFAHYHSSSTLPATPQTPYPLAEGTHRPDDTIPDPPPSALREYLGLRARILLTTLSPALLPLVLTIAHLIQNRSSTASLAASLKRSLLAACSGLATGAAGLLTMPRYLAMQTNEQAIRTTQASILAIGAAIGDCVTIIEVVVAFIVDTYRSLLLCTIELVVRGTLEILIQAVKTISDGITSSLNSIRAGIQNDIASANNFIQDAVARVNSLTSKVNINISVPEFTIPSLSGLENVQIPTGFEDTLVKLNSTLPTLSELKEKMNELLEIPFEALKKEINETRIEMAASFNSTILPVPSLSQLSASRANEIHSELCSDLDTSLIDNTARALHKLSNIAIGLMFLLLFLIWAAMVVWEWRRWTALKDTVETIEDEWQRDQKKDAWRVVAIVEHPVLEKYGSPIIARLAPNRRTRTNLRWYMSYLAHPTCLALLFIAFLGFLSIQFQLLALEGIKSHAKATANETVTQSSHDLTAKLNQLAFASSQQYANDFNAAIVRYENRINDELFGKWLNTTAISLNATLNEFYDGVEDVLNKTFGSTILYNPVNTFMYCILGSKIDNIEKGLTWISQHAQVSLPKLPPDVLLLSNDSMKEVAEPISAAAVGSSTDGKDDGVVGSLIEHFESALRVERAFYAILLGVWLAFALIGIIVVIWNSGGSDKYTAWRDARRPEGGPSNGPTTAVWPWDRKEHPIYDEHTEEEKQFRGISPSPNPPAIIEPTEKVSFFDHGDRSKSRPFLPRSSTIASSLSSLAAPGQAFLRLAGKDKTDEGSVRLTDGNRSERYNATRGEAQNDTKESLDDGLETPPPFWVNKFYRAVDSAKTYFPTRGQRHGAAMMRGHDQAVGESYTSQSAMTLQQNRSEGTAVDGTAPRWSMADLQGIGRALDGTGTDSRYPPLPASSAPLPASSYPRRLSRAPTLYGGATIKNVFADPPHVPGKHDSVDYIRDEYEEDVAEDQARRPESYDYDYEVETTRDASSPMPSSTASFVHSEAHVESVNRVQTGTAALAAILANMKGRGEVETRDPFVSEAERRVERGARI